MTYQDVICSDCGNEVCQCCGCCYTSNCERCSCPVSLKDKKEATKSPDDRMA